MTVQRYRVAVRAAYPPGSGLSASLEEFKRTTTAEDVTIHEDGERETLTAVYPDAEGVDRHGAEEFALAILAGELERAGLPEATTVFVVPLAALDPRSWQ